jgi:hypothetical protein
MLQDFLTGRLASDTTTLPSLARGGGEFQPMTPSRIGSLAAPDAAAPTEKPRLEEPQVEIVEDGGKVQRIVVTCTCCEKIEIECEY